MNNKNDGLPHAARQDSLSRRGPDDKGRAETPDAITAESKSMQESITLEHIVHPEMLTCTADTLLSEAARQMTAARYSSILVTQNGAIVGIWTERDALALDMSDPLAFQAPIGDHMASPVKTIHIGADLGEAAVHFREEKVRHLLAVDDDGTVRGIVTQTDIVLNQGLEYYLSLRQVKSVFNGSYPVVASNVPLAAAVRTMLAGRFDALLVAYPDGSHGIFTERDVLHRVGGTQSLFEVGESASHPLVCVTLDTSLYQARKLLVERQLRHLGVTGSDGRLRGLLAFSDILTNIESDYIRQLRDALKEREHSLALSLQHLRLAAKVFKSTLEGIMVTNARQIIESVNPAFTQITGYKAHEVIGKTPAILSSGRHDAAFYQKMQSDLSVHGHWQGEIWNRRRSGEIYPEWLTINTVRNTRGEAVNFVGVFSDITKRKAAEKQMQFLAYHDGLTGLPNRELFYDRLEHAIAHAHRNRRMVAVMFLDLNKFKQINDTLGHHVGDQLLQMVAQRLTASVREGDTVARLGGDEFIVVLESVAQAADVSSVAQKIMAALSQPIHLDEHEINVGTSIGISLYPTDGEQPHALIKCADAAMYLAKQGEHSNFRFFNAADSSERSAG